MYSFTSYGSEVWTGMTYDGLPCGPRFTDETQDHSHTGVNEYFTADASTSGITKRLEDTFHFGGTHRNEFRVMDGITYSITSNSFSSTGTTVELGYFTESTSTEAVPSQSGPPTSAATTVTRTLNYTFNANESSSGFSKTEIIRNDTSRGLSQEDSFRSGNTESYFGDPTSSTTEFSSDSTSFPAGASTSENLTVRGSSEYATEEATMYYSTSTITYTGYTVEGGDPVHVTFSPFSTWSSTWSTTTATTTVGGATTTASTSLSTWGTTWSTVDTDTTTTDAGTGTTAEITAVQDTTSFVTEVAGTGTGTFTRVQDFTFTHHSNSPLRDTIVLQRADEFSDYYSLGHVLWLFDKSSETNLTSHSKGVFTDFYTTSSDLTITISDYRKFVTSSFAAGTVTLASTTYESISTSSVGPNTTHTVTATMTNGVFTTHTSDNTFLYQTVTETFSLGDIGTILQTSVETYTTTTDTDAPPASSTGSTTLFTHTDYVSGYETDGALSFTLATSVGFWSSTSRSFLTEKWASTYSSTVIKPIRLVASFAILADSHTVIGAGTDTTRVFLGKFSTATSKVYSYASSTTSSAFYIPEMCSISTVNETASTSDTVNHVTSGSTGTTIVSAGHSLTHWTFKRAGIRMESTSAGHEAPYGDIVRYTVPAYGHVGFVGSFTQPDQSVYLTTECGLSSGSVFDTAWTMTPPAGKSLFEEAGATIYPVNERNLPSLIGVGLVNSSLMETPTAMTTCLSVAATWTTTQTYTGGTSTATTTAVHTIGVVSAISGEFLTERPISFSDGNSNIGINGLFATTGGFGAGDNRMNASATVFVGMGRVSWTERASGQSTGGDSYSTQGDGLTVSFTIPQGVGLVISEEPLLTMSWDKTTAIPGGGDHIQFTTPHQSHELP